MVTNFKDSAGYQYYVYNGTVICMVDVYTFYANILYFIDMVYYFSLLQSVCVFLFCDLGALDCYRCSSC